MKRFYRNFTKRTLLSIFIVHLSLLSFSATYYVSNAGNDTNSGLTTALPWKSLSKVNSFSFVAGDQILFNRGDIFYGTLSLHNRFGTSGNPITYGVYGTGNKPVITGFTTVTAWTNEGSGVYSKIITAESQTNMVTINGTQYSMGRYPNTGHLTYESASTNVSITDNQLGSAINWNGAEAVISKNYYDIDRCLITNHTGNIITYTNLGSPSNANSAVASYFIQNDLRTLDQFGEWYHNTLTGKFYMYFGSDSPTNYTINVATLKNLIFAGSGEDNITIDNINCMGSIKDAIYLCWQNDNSKITNCDVSFAGLDAIQLAGANCTISGCTIKNCNRVGIMSYITNATITDNSITNQGILEGQGSISAIYRGAIFAYNNNVNISRNIIENCGYDGIPLSSNVQIATIKNNYIKNSCILSVDQGAIYLAAARTSILIDGNIIEISGGNGIYLDEYTTNTKVWNNTVSGCKIDGIKLHKAHDNSIKNNTSFNNKIALGFENWLNESNIYNDSVYNNKFIAKTANQYTASYINWYSSNNIGKLNNNFYARPIDDNLTVEVSYVAGGKTLSTKTLSQWQVITGQDVSSYKSPQTISAETDFQFECNTSATIKNITLSRPMIDVKGAKYSGSITLQPYSSIVLMKDLTPVVVPGAPTSPVATAGNASASVTFVAPASNGGSAITGYTVTSLPAGGIDSNAGSTSLTHTITGLTNGTSYTFTIKATNSVGTSVTSVASNSVIPKAPAATSFVFTGPSTGNVNSASANFTVTPNNTYTGTITLTPSGAGSVGLSAKVLTFSGSSTAQAFTITPTVAGSITLTPTNNGSLTNPANLTYITNAVVSGAPTSVIAVAGNASASVTFVTPASNGGSAITGYTVTSIPAGGIDANAGSTSLTHTITGLTNGTSYTFTVKASNSAGTSVASLASNTVTPVEVVVIKQGDITPSHFITVWQGLNGLNHMNIIVASATLEDLPLSVGDEIAVFSGSACVGSAKLNKSIVPTDNTSFLTILASQSDGSNNGFIENDTIIFKVWDNTNKVEKLINGAVYRNDVATWKTTGRYVPGSTAMVEITSYKVYTQSIELLKGYNMISTYVSAPDPSASVVTKTLVDQGNLIKMQDETGNSFENWGDFGGWINQLGALEKTEGYKIQVANNCTLQVTGRPIAMPLNISLKTGWNIISYPRTDLVSAMNVVQALIDQNKLVKVQDEAGNSIENWGLFGGWKNGIGNFIPGKAYKVKMSADAVLAFLESYPKSAVVIAHSEPTEYYHSSVEGHGTDHMNINIADLNSIGISVGDELAAFDGSVCVATTKITEANLLSGSACLVSSFSTDNQNPNGFKVGDPIQISLWSMLSGNESKVTSEVITGQMKYEKNSSVLVKMKSATIATGIISLDDLMKIDVFPNPCQGKVTVRFSEIPEANSRIEISDISGRKLISRIVSGTSEKFNLDSFTPGLYLVRSILGKSEYIHKLIVNK